MFAYVCLCVRSWVVCGTAAIHQRSPLSLWQLDRSHLPFEYSCLLHYCSMLEYSYFSIDTVVPIDIASVSARHCHSGFIHSD